MSFDEETLKDENTGEIAGEDVRSRNCINQMEENSTSEETEATELIIEAGVSGNNVVQENDIGDSHFESTVASLPLNSDRTEKSYVTSDGGKGELDNSPASASYKTDTVAAAENFEGERNRIPAPEENPFLQSVKYLEKHQILRLFQVRFVDSEYFVMPLSTPMKRIHNTQPAELSNFISFRRSFKIAIKFVIISFFPGTDVQFLELFYRLECQAALKIRP